MHRRLLIRPGAIGDCILALPELESYCDAGGSVCASDYTEIWAPRTILPVIKFVNHTRAIADTGLDLVGITDHPRALADLATFDSIYSWYGSNRPEFRDAVRHLPFTFFPALPINRIGETRIAIPQQTIKNFAVIHPFSGGAKKNWPVDNFHETAARLGINTRFCAGPEDTFEPAVRIDNLFDLACWLATARVYIGNDSGITHLAAAAGVPTVAIFLSTDPKIWAPRGQHVVVLENPNVDAVVDAARQITRVPR